MQISHRPNRRAFARPAQTRLVVGSLVRNAITESRGRIFCLFAGLIFLTAPPPASAVDEFHAFILPTDICEVAVDSVFIASFWAGETAMQFNAYEVEITFDPTLLAFEGVAEGALMVQNCPQTFRVSSQTDSTVTYAHSLLCAGVSLDGPGTLSVYSFRALEPGTTALTITSDPDRTFVDDGLWIWPDHPTYPRQVIFHHANVCIEDPTSSAPPVTPLDPAGDGLRLEVSPHPIAPGSVIRLRRPGPTSTVLDLIDVGGRIIWQQVVDGGGSGWMELPWPAELGRSDRRHRGLYLLRARAGEHQETLKVIRLD